MVGAGGEGSPERSPAPESGRAVVGLRPEGAASGLPGAGSDGFRARFPRPPTAPGGAEERGIPRRDW